MVKGHGKEYGATVVGPHKPDGNSLAVRKDLHEEYVS